MATSPTIQYARNVLDHPVEDELGESYLAYAVSTILTQAIPDVRDGLKPVQRRILWSMFQSHYLPDRPHVKCAKPVGNTIGTYHPHGDISVYEALVRMGQSHSMNVTLVDPHGNFGTADDPPAAHRYTECRLTRSALDLIGEVSDGVLDMVPTFDNSDTEPICFAGSLPNLLVNGTVGIAVGMRTEIPPHNLRELVVAAKRLLADPELSDEQFLKLVPAPDWPTAGIVYADEMRDLMSKGRGVITLDAHVQLQPGERDTQVLVFDQLPYAVGPTQIIDRIQELVKAGSLPGLASAQDMTSRTEGTSLHVHCKPGADPAEVLGQLRKLTPLRKRISVHQLAIQDGRPQLVTTRAALQCFLDWRLDRLQVLTTNKLARTNKELAKQQALVAVVADVRKVVNWIMASDDMPTARQKLMKGLNLDQEQADYILEMPMRRLVRLERDAIMARQQTLQNQAAELRAILDNPATLKDILVRDLDRVAESYGTPRRTQILDAPQDLQAAQATMGWVQVSTSGQIGVLTSRSRMELGSSDIMSYQFPLSRSSRITSLDSLARATMVPVLALPEIGRTRGATVRQVVGNDIRTFVPDVPADHSVVLLTNTGQIKRLGGDTWKELQSGHRVFNLEPGEELLLSAVIPPGGEVGLVSSDGYGMRFSVEQLRPLGRNAAGVSGIKLNDGMSPVAMGAVSSDTMVALHIDGKGWLGMPSLHLMAQSRGTRGHRIAGTKPRDTILAAIFAPVDSLVYHDGNRLVPIPSNGIAVGSQGATVGLARQVRPPTEKDQ